MICKIFVFPFMWFEALMFENMYVENGMGRFYLLPTKIFFVLCLHTCTYIYV